MSAERDDAEATIAKSLRLRGTSPKVARISRRALAVTGVVVCAGLTASLAWSLVEHRRPAPEAVDPPPPATPPEQVTAMPRGYAGPAGVPMLGPPMPGDLGRPILSAQRQGRSVSDPIETPQAPRASAVQAPIDVEADAQAAARRAARQSNLFIAAAIGRGDGDHAPEAAAPPPDADPRTTSLERLQSPASPYVLQAGAVIPAALVTGLRSDAPGPAIAQVTQDVHDSLAGGFLLIPAGSRLIGDYDAQVQSGQSRLKVDWTRLILPSGRSIVLDRLPGADAQGMAGLEDGVDRHGRRVLAAAGLTTLLAIGAEAGASDEDALVRAIRRAGSTSASQVGQQLVGKSVDLAPTLTIRPGAPLRVLLTRDLVLEPYVEGSAR